MIDRKSFRFRAVTVLVPRRIKSEVHSFQGVAAKPIAQPLHGGSGKLLSEENDQTPLRPRTGDIKEVPIALEGGLFVGGDLGIVRCQFEHRVEIMPIPSSADDNDHVLELGAFDAVLRLEWRVARQIAAQGDDLLVWNGPEVAELLQRSRHALASLSIELPQFAFAPLNGIGKPLMSDQQNAWIVSQ